MGQVGQWVKGGVGQAGRAWHMSKGGEGGKLGGIDPLIPRPARHSPVPFPKLMHTYIYIYIFAPRRALPPLNLRLKNGLGSESWR